MLTEGYSAETLHRLEESSTADRKKSFDDSHDQHRLSNFALEF